MSDTTNHAASPSRRSFLKTSSALVGGAFVGAANTGVARGAHPGGSDEIKVALIGCGGRGNGAITQALATKGPVTFWAAADAIADTAGACAVAEWRWRRRRE